MQDPFYNRQHIIRIVLILVGLIFVGKAFQIQVLDGSYSDRANSVAVHKIVQYPSRGLILDRNNKILVNNTPMYDLMVTYDQVGEMDTSKFCRLLKITREDFNKNIEQDWSDYRYDKKIPFAFMKSIPGISLAEFQESMYEFPGFFIQQRNIRQYPQKVGAHVLGYLSEVSPRQIEDAPEKFILGDYVGSNGIELNYDNQLRGRKGYNYVLKDNFGRVQGKYAEGRRDSSAIKGHDLVTTLDVELQKYAEQLMANKRGAIVAIEPASGEVLALVSTPSYDPNLLSMHRNRGAVFNALVTDTMKPFFNRALSAQYPPGSIYKSMMSLVGMESGIWNSNRGFSCGGGYNYGGKKPLGCHSHPYPSNVTMAMQHSCNAYYCQMFRDVVEQYGFKQASKGLDTLASYLKTFGVGSKLGIDIPGEKSGNLPDSKTYNRIYPNGGWRAPTIISLAIGQGETEMTTLQMANVVSAIANRGWFKRPHLVKGFNTMEGYFPIEKKEVFSTRASREHYAPVIDGMELAVQAGTATMARVDSISICGKTGTSENVHGKDHSVFFCFAPKENPQIAMAVFIENAGFGGTYAAPIASLLIESYLKDGAISPKRKWIEQRMLDANLLQNK